MQAYRTITASGGTHEIEIKNSRFIAHIQRVFSEAEAKIFINQIQKAHWKANHNCVAFQIGDNHEIQRALDDGEPSGTAGVPMLEVLKQNDLHNVIVVVTRYFGGTKLGSGGLVRAYSHAVSEALQHIGIVERQPQNDLALTVDYALSGTIENWIQQSPFTLLDTIYLENVTFHTGVPIAEVEATKKTLIDLTSANIQFKVGDEKYVDVPISTFHSSDNT